MLTTEKMLFIVVAGTNIAIELQYIERVEHAFEFDPEKKPNKALVGRVSFGQQKIQLLDVFYLIERSYRTVNLDLKFIFIRNGEDLCALMADDISTIAEVSPSDCIPVGHAFRNGKSENIMFDKCYLGKEGLPVMILNVKNLFSMYPAMQPQFENEDKNEG